MEAASDFIVQIHLTFHSNHDSLYILLGYIPFDPHFGGVMILRKLEQYLEFFFYTLKVRTVQLTQLTLEALFVKRANLIQHYPSRFSMKCDVHKPRP